MYSVRLGFKNANKRIKRLIKNKHYPEAVIVTFATGEKMIRRTMKQLIVDSGQSKKKATKIVNSIRTIKDLNKNWKDYNSKKKRLVEIVGNKNWESFMTARKMRNDFIHGSKVYSKKEAKEVSQSMFKALDEFNNNLIVEHQFSGWEKIKKR